MVSFSTAASMASLFLAASERSKRNELQEHHESMMEDRGEESNGLPPEQAMADQTNQKLDKLIEIEQKNQPTPADRDAYASTVVPLKNGEVGDVTYEPADGWNLRVKEVHFDRRDDHEYEINVGGDVTSVSHRAKYSSPRTVTQSDRISATVINESGSDSVVDFEIIGWAERPASDGVK